MWKMKSVGIVGATGYAGVELCRLLLSHPEVEIKSIASQTFAGKKLSEVYPAFYGICDMELISPDDISGCDILFLALPHGLSEEYTAKVIDSGTIVIDLGADFRLEDESEYEAWYRKTFTHPELHALSAYGLPELFRESIKGKKIIANPGCYPTATALGVYPALKTGLCDPKHIIVDAKSGVTGSGRNLSEITHYPECNEAFAPYKVAEHRHTPEIEQTLSKAVDGVRITFVPHLLPLNRGIIITSYIDLKDVVEEDYLREVYEKFYSNEKFVRFLPKGKVANLKNVKFTNYCDVSIHVDKRTNTLVTVSTIDNMVKGAAGQAVQNMNIALNLPEDMGLDIVPPSF